MEAMAQRQRVGFQTRRLGVRIPLASLFYNSREIGWGLLSGVIEEPS
jgi:hypothetical protein